MIKHNALDPYTLHKLIKTRFIRYAGNQNYLIYGTLNCKTGKRMNPENRVFFSSEEEALENGYRPCGHCMKEKYRLWISLNK